MEKNMIIAMSCTPNWYHYLMVDLYSLLECTKTVKKIYILGTTEFVEDIPYLQEVIDKYQVEVVLKNIEGKIDEYLSMDSPNRDTVYSNMCFSRLLLADIVEEDKVLYIDTDAIVRRDISNVWNYDISSYYLAGVSDIGVYTTTVLEDLSIDDKYVNSGFVVFNLKKIREENIISKWFELINERELRFPDQDALNYVCTHNEFFIHSMYNYACGSTLDVLNHDLIKVFHYTGDKSHWVRDRYCGEEWCDAEEKFYNEFGWYKYGVDHD